jgi:phage anti-repressor protein
MARILLIYCEDYDESAKGNLDWLEKLLIDKPKLIDAAVINSNQRSRQSEEPFLTVQDLTKRLKELERD